ncbi:MAG: DUF3419 family protein [Chitinophagaceae bacterium]|nr:DUF3419 family protein [Oligoflexus sp.]
MAEKYFNALNYSLANEDTRLEVELCLFYKPASILSICGSGGRFLPLLASNPKKIIALDLAPQQLYLAELRQLTIKILDFEGFLLFWGYPPYKTTENRTKRQNIFNGLRLSPDCRQYFEDLFSSCNWEGLIYQGKWEKTMTVVPKYLRKVIGGTYDKMFSFKNQDEQNRYLQAKMNDRIWKIVPKSVMMVFGNAAFFNAMLYRGHFVKKNIPGDYYEFYRDAFKRLFANGLARENYFLQLLFFSELRYPEGNPIEAIAGNFNACKKALENNPEIDLVQDNILAFSKKTKETFDFISLSDVPSYFEGPSETNYLQDLRRCLNPNAIIVVRAYLRIPVGTLLDGYEDITDQHAEAIAKEKVQMYRIFIYRYKG